MPNINVNNYKHINLENEEKKIKILAKISKDYSIKIWEKNRSHLGKGHRMHNYEINYGSKLMGSIKY